MTDDSSLYLSLSAASQLLGVHSTTLRRWADAGAIPVYVTPGGHRRFARGDIETLAARKPFSTRALGSAWAARALAQARHSLATAPASGNTWLARIDDAEQLFVLARAVDIVQHHPHELLGEARRIGVDYAAQARRTGMPLTAALEAALFFRDSLVESAMQLSEDVHPRPEESARLMRRISRVANEVHLAVAAAYEAAL
jgi:excisionase family DNA binding protein